MKPIAWILLALALSACAPHGYYTGQPPQISQSHGAPFYLAGGVGRMGR